MFNEESVCLSWTVHGDGKRIAGSGSFLGGATTGNFLIFPVVELIALGWFGGKGYLSTFIVTSSWVGRTIANRTTTKGIDTYR